jgi:hypothetical protein
MSNVSVFFLLRFFSNILSPFYGIPAFGFRVCCQTFDLGPRSAASLQDIGTIAVLVSVIFFIRV